jgi:hypothetical protein
MLLEDEFVSHKGDRPACRLERRWLNVASKHDLRPYAVLAVNIDFKCERVIVALCLKVE